MRAALLMHHELVYLQPRAVDSEFIDVVKLFFYSACSLRVQPHRCCDRQHGQKGSGLTSSRVSWWGRHGQSLSGRWVAWGARLHSAYHTIPGGPELCSPAWGPAGLSSQLKIILSCRH